MTQEEKDLLLKDLCARLPYGVKCYEDDVEYAFDIIGSTSNNKEFVFSDGYERNLEQIKPYLRPFSSMTKEELKEFYIIEGLGEHPVIWNKPQYDWHFTVNGIDWLNSHHFDYRGLIEKGLVLQAPEGMYKTWNSLRGNLKEDNQGNIVGGLKL